MDEERVRKRRVGENGAGGHKMRTHARSPEEQLSGGNRHKKDLPGSGSGQQGLVEKGH